MKKISCSKCKKPITSHINRLGGGLLCDDCYPFGKDSNGKVCFKERMEGTLTFGKYGYYEAKNNH